MTQSGTRRRVPRPSAHRAGIGAEPAADARRRLLVYVQGPLTGRRYRSIRTGLERDVERLHGIVDRVSRKRIVLDPDPRLLWAEADSLQRRELVRLLVEQVDVMPACRGARLNPSRLPLEIPLLPAPPNAGA
jgi:hypothetical protein